MQKESLLASMPKLILAVVLIVCVGAVMGLMGYALTKKQTMVKTPEVKAPDEIADWQTYRNEEFEFEVKYPEEWYYNRDKQAEKGVDYKLHVGFAESTGILDQGTPYPVEFMIWSNKIGIRDSGPCDYEILNKKNNEQYVLRTCDFNRYGKIMNKMAESFKFIEKEEVVFQKSGESEFFGTLTLTGYLDVKRWICNEGDMCTETVDYASFVFEDTDNDLIYDFLGNSAGNSFIGDNSIGIGCYKKDKNIIHSMNLGDSGRVENIISGEDLNKLLNSDKNNLVKLKLTKPAPAPGMGAPECYSYFRLFEIL